MSKDVTDSEKILLSAPFGLAQHKSYLQRPDLNSCKTQIPLLMQNSFLKAKFTIVKLGIKLSMAACNESVVYSLLLY